MAKKRNFNQAFSDRLAMLMDKSGTTINELANVLGITRQAIGNYLACETMPNINVCKDIAEYFNVSSDYLIGKNSQPNITDEDIYNKYGLTSATLTKLRTIKDSAKIDESSAFLLYIINTLIQIEDTDNENGLLLALTEFLNYEAVEHFLLAENEITQFKTEEKQWLKKLTPADLDNLKITHLNRMLIDLKREYHESYRKNLKLEVYQYLNQPNEDGYYYDEDKDLYFKGKNFYRLTEEGYEPI